MDEIKKKVGLKWLDNEIKYINKTLRNIKMKNKLNLLKFQERIIN